jgi:hypothetical protein
MEDIFIVIAVVIWEYFCDFEKEYLMYMGNLSDACKITIISCGFPLKSETRRVFKYFIIYFSVAIFFCALFGFPLM